MKKYFLTYSIFCLLAAGCVSMHSQPTSDRQPARSLDAQSITICKNSFAKATSKFKLLMEKTPDYYSDALKQNLAVLMPKVNVECTDHINDSFGFEIHPANFLVIIEDQMPSLHNLFISDIGKEAAEKYNINFHYVTYDRLLEAVAAQVYAELSNSDNPKYDTFFKTLKLMEK